MKISVSVERPVQFKEIDTRWTEIKIGDPFAARSNPASCIQAGDIDTHGGWNPQEGALGDMYSAKIYDLPTKWTKLPQNGKKPGSLRNHTIFTHTSYLILYGGQKNMMENNNKVYIYDLKTHIWYECQCQKMTGKQQSLPALDSHSVLVQNGQAYILFGYDSQKADLSKVSIVMDLKQVSEHKIAWDYIQIDHSKAPQPRTMTATCIFKHEIFLFGGGTQFGTLNDMWILDIKTSKWEQVKLNKEHQYWPQKRKGHCLVVHPNSGNLFMFGGLKQITKQQNDVCIFLRQRLKWVEIHSNTNELYAPSPLMKRQIEDSPNILQAKRNRKFKSKAHSPSGFQLAVKSTTSYGQMKRANTTTTEIKPRQPTMKTEIDGFVLGRKMSVVQQKKYREFMSRKNKLLGQISKGGTTQPKRSHSPTSQALLYSINTIGDQQNVQKGKELQKYEIPKVIFDEEKGVVIGKKPCARDGHVGLVHEDYMIVIGGDRHMVSFNDSYIFKMDKAMQSIHHYL